MKKGVLILILASLPLALLGCSVFQSNSIAGTYYGQQNPELYIKINTDKTFSALFIKGTYEVNGNELTLLTGLGAFTYLIKDNTLSPVGGSNSLTGSQVFAKRER